MPSHCKAAEPSHSLYLDVSAVGRKVHLHHKAGDVPAAVDAVQLRAERQVIEVDRTLSRAYGQVTRVWTEPIKKKAPGVTRDQCTVRFTL